ncbi:MAG: hypothetical protein Q9163_001057 [Psora crenata]
MADDTRQSPHSAPNPEIGSYRMPVTQIAPDNANVLPGGSSNTAGGKTKEASIIDAIKSIHLADFKEVHKKPCVRDALMTGIGAGFGIGGVRTILGGKLPHLTYNTSIILLTWTATVLGACNWAVGTFCFGSFLMYEYCQRKRYLEMQGMKRAVEVMDRKKTEKQIQAEAVKTARRNAREQS